ncbi:MAG TPA: amidohydrolase family protein [Acidimicrobiales bacterium]|nr:amidohydrolase family protein [Acidimicrobiales bacterium]
MLDLVISGGTVIDGTGSPMRPADVGVRDGRIAVVAPPGTIDEPHRSTLDAGGRYVAPGFVDLHTHYDAQLFWDPLATPSPFHGVTTVIGGNCGFSLAPLTPDHADYLMRMMARVEGMPLDALSAGLAWDWGGFGEWLDRLDGTTAVNAGFLCGHSALRRVAGADREVMQRLLHEALDAGALGFSTSQAHTHNDGDGEPVPSRFADDDELLALAGCVAKHEGTTLEAIVAGCINGFTDDEVELLAGMSRAGERPLNWNVLGVSSLNPTGHERQLAASDAAAARGGRVVALTLPHPMSMRLSFLTGFVLDGLPGWREILHLPVPERLRALGDPAVRERLVAGAASREAGLLRGLANWPVLTFAECFAAATKPHEGRSVADVAAELGQQPFDTLLDVVIADDLRTGLRPPVFGTSDADWELRAQVWRDPRTVIGGSDAGAHLDMMCGAIYSTSLLGEAVRQRELMSWEEAVHQLTDVPARLYGLRERGRIAEGWHADLVVLDPETVGHGPERTATDLPGGAWRLVADAAGVEHVYANGVAIVRGGQPTGATPGTLLRSGRDTVSVLP